MNYEKSSLRLRVASYLDRSRVGLYLELLQALLSLVSCCVYVGESYYREDVPYWMDVVDFVLVLVFLSDFCLHIFIAEKKLAYVFSRDGMIDLLTVLPTLIGMVATTANSYQHIFFFLRPLRVLRAVRILRFLPAATKSTAARRQLILLLFSAFCLIFIFSGLFQYVENNSVLGVRIVRNVPGEEYGFLPFHESVYFIVILAYTVSFGNPVPTNWLGKLVAMCYITVTTVVIPIQIRKLVKILAMQKDGGWVVKSRKNPHFIATGSINPPNFSSFLNDFFDERNKHDRTKVVVLSANIQPDEDLDIIHSPFIEKQVIWLLGSVLVPIDLLRSRVRTAVGAFIFADNVAVDPNKEDKLNIMRALALRKHNPNMPVSLQLIDSSWKAHVDDSSIFAFALDEIKMSMMAWSTLYPGYSTLISNILMWRLQISPPLVPSIWLKEYVTGLNQTIFETEVPQKFQSDTYSHVVEDVYNQCGIAIVGLRKSGDRKISFMPLDIDYRLSIGDSFILIADAAQLQEFSGNSRFLKNVQLRDSRRRIERVPLLGKLLRRRDIILDSFGLDVQTDHQELQEEATVTGENTGFFFHESYEESLASRRVRKRFGKAVREINHQDIMRSPFRPPEQPRELNRVSPTKMLLDLDEPKSKARSLEDCTIPSRLDPHIRGHVVLCGCPRSRYGLLHFMQPYLNAARLPADATSPILVVILAPEPPSQTTWAEVSEMTNILYLKGSGMNAEHLHAVGVDRARAVVVLSMSAGLGSGLSKSKTHVESADALYLQDADVILTTRAIQNYMRGTNANVFTISETAHTKTFNLLAYNNTEAEFFLSPEFAAGYFYDTGMTERLIYQCHEKQFIKDMLDKLFTTKNKKRNTFISQIPVPPLETLTYGAVFAYCIVRNMVPIGLYREQTEDVNGSNYFVTINPPANTFLSTSDRVFVWCSVRR